VLIDITTFRLVDGVDEATFRAADEVVQHRLQADAVGLVRRTTTVGADGEWAVITLWWSAAEADAAAGTVGADDFFGCVDASSLTSRRYETLD
jgi:hypothetical protein